MDKKHANHLLLGLITQYGQQRHKDALDSLMEDITSDLLWQVVRALENKVSKNDGLDLHLIEGVYSHVNKINGTEYEPDHVRNGG